jgi:hypothetical protein
MASYATQARELTEEILPRIAHGVMSTAPGGGYKVDVRELEYRIAWVSALKAAADRAEGELYTLQAQLSYSDVTPL